MEITIDNDDPTGAGLMIGPHKVKRVDYGKSPVERDGAIEHVYRELLGVVIDGKAISVMVEVPAHLVEVNGYSRACEVRMKELMVGAEALKREIEKAK